ncbi:hypothetical protein IU500_21190 [Nocardia terpenica]|uniref:Conjugal transfer protein TrbC n=1 Tax=Nocardia terpenica TaxID=455432 RepID=A0A164N6J5_9NOCA|nr:hypothetical protein [Nocardia terpenica]KZM74034.1 hypothetical protein AWN90_31385 [Nocardia terpenica]MBF6064220.1 hypothetical protein [Nocardia terpenica]MBF6106553.1 hypothetical protein [Nocardia terpenica]MBF6113838.1 hypothetical protein [Nocardia terpenica]MBF6120538.1 hypothetical protein [Nocardia terpenica]
MIITAAYEFVLAQITNPTPETPPAADKIMKLVRYFTWFVLLSGTTAIIYAGGRFAWEKWSGGALQSPKMIAGALVGGVVATSAGTIMNSIIGS